MSCVKSHHELVQRPNRLAELAATPSVKPDKLPSKETIMFGKLIGAYIGEKVLASSGRGAAGAVGGAATAVIARRGLRPLALLLAAGYGYKKLKEYRARQGAAA